MPEESSSNFDIFGLLSVDKEAEEKRKQRKELLASTGVKEFFEEGEGKKLNFNNEVVSLTNFLIKNLCVRA